MIRKLLRLGALAGAITIGLAACDEDSLKVVNPNDPESERLLGTPGDVESLIGSYYRRWHSGIWGVTGNVTGMMAVMSFENYSSLANDGQNARAGIPRPGNDNSIGNVVQGNQRLVYDRMAEVNRVTSSVLTTMAQTDPPFSLGTAAQDIRGRAFSEFLRGLSLGYLALAYDSGAVISEGMSSVEPGELRGYREVMDSAVAALQRAIDHASLPGATLAIPQEWIPSSTTLTMGASGEFVRLIRSYRARLQAGVARTPAERAAAPWAAIIADAQNGITADHDNITNTTTGPFNGWVRRWEGFTTWHQMTPFIMGMADTSGSYATWIGKHIDARDGFTMATPDLRFPQGATRAAQQDDFAITQCNTAATPCKRYYRNRPAGNDLTNGLGWGWSEYDFTRWRNWHIAGSGPGGGANGPFPFYPKAELDMLQAEGLIRTGQLAAAADLINLTRTAGMVDGVATGGGLTPVTALGIPNEPGGGCVPSRVTNAGHGGGGTVGCWAGVDPAVQLMEAMKWEKRLETQQAAWGAWFFDGRGWGDLTAGTPFHWAAPYQDLQARQRPIYNADANTGAVAATSGYGW